MSKKSAKIDIFEFSKFRPGIALMSLKSATQCKIDRLTRRSGQYGPIKGKNGPKSNLCEKSIFMAFLGIFSGASYGIPVTRGDRGVEVWHTGHFAIRWGCGDGSNILKEMVRGLR